MYKLDETDALFLAYYYTFEFKGSYPFITTINGKLTEIPGELFKHLIRDIIGLKSIRAEMQIIDYLRTYTKAQIIRKATQEFEILKKRKNFADRILFVYNTVARIRNAWQKHKTSLVESEKMDNQENVQNDNVVSDDTQMKYKTPEEYKQATGRRFRMTKNQKNRGLTRQQAFVEFMNKDQ